LKGGRELLAREPVKLPALIYDYIDTENVHNNMNECCETSKFLSNLDCGKYDDGPGSSKDSEQVL